MLLVGGATPRHRWDAEIALRLGTEVRAFAQTAGGSVFAVTSRRTGAEAAEALGKGLGASSYVHCWQPGQPDSPYLAYLALADVLVVTGESESMLAEAAAAGKPIYIYPLPERLPGLKARLKDWVVARAQACPANHGETARPQQGIDYLCVLLITRGIVRPRRDLNALHNALIRLGIARFFGESLNTGSRPVLRESDEVARKVRTMLGFMNS
jgi:mitochondrial fission protein ELM1